MNIFKKFRSKSDSTIEYNSTNLLSHDMETMTKLLSFCKKEHNEENIYFIIDMLQYKKLDSNSLKAKQMLNTMYTKYFTQNSEYELNLPENILRPIHVSFNDLHTNTSTPRVKQQDYSNIFNDAYQHVIHMIDFDILPRYHKTLQK